MPSRWVSSTSRTRRASSRSLISTIPPGIRPWSGGQPSTTTVPVIEVVDAAHVGERAGRVERRRENVCPCSRSWLTKDPSALFTECANPSSLVQVTALPTFTVTVSGEKAKSWMTSPRTSDRLTVGTMSLPRPRWVAGAAGVRRHASSQGEGRDADGDDRGGPMTSDAATSGHDGCSDQYRARGSRPGVHSVVIWRRPQMHDGVFVRSISSRIRARIGAPSARDVLGGEAGPGGAEEHHDVHALQGEAAQRRRATGSGRGTGR